jgi:NAD(P)H-flavin reductase
MTTFLKSLKKGNKVDLVGPYGDFIIDKEGYKKQEYLFIASGVGIGPFHAFIKSYPDLKYKVIHGVRNLKDSIMSKDFNEESYFSCITGEEGGDFKGRVTSFLKDYNIGTDTNCYIFGNPYMLREVNNILKKNGVKNEAIFIEAYYAY